MRPKRKHALSSIRQPIPVSFRRLELGSGATEYATEAVSIFQNGFVITSPEKLKIGSFLRMRMTLFEIWQK